MKITDIRCILLTGPSTNDRFLKEARGRRSATFIEIHTDTELVGLGETYAGYFSARLRTMSANSGNVCIAAVSSGAALDSVFPC